MHTPWWSKGHAAQILYVHSEQLLAAAADLLLSNTFPESLPPSSASKQIKNTRSIRRQDRRATSEYGIHFLHTTLP